MTKGNIHYLVEYLYTFSCCQFLVLTYMYFKQVSGNYWLEFPACAIRKFNIYKSLKLKNYKICNCTVLVLDRFACYACPLSLSSG